MLWGWGQDKLLSRTHLALHQHGHVHEHVVQLSNAGLQLDDLTVPCLNLAQGLLRDAGVHDDLENGTGLCARTLGSPGQKQAKALE